MKHPMQPTYEDHGVARFKSNMIVRHLLDRGGFDMNDIAKLSFSKEDRVQFAQLIGYSLGGFDELGYVSMEESDTAWTMHEQKVNELQARNIVLEQQLTESKRLVRELASTLFSIHPDDLED